MKVILSTQVDCDVYPVKATVEAQVVEGHEDLDLTLYDAMAEVCRLLAKAARDDQRRIHDEAGMA